MNTNIDSIRKSVQSIPEHIAAPPFPRTIEGRDAIVKIADFVAKWFPDVTPEQIDTAFEMVAAGVLTDGDNQIIVDTYGRPVTTGIVGRVLRAHQNQIKRMVTVNRPTNDEPTVDRPPAAWHFEKMMTEVRATGKLPAFHAFGIITKYMIEQKMIRSVPAERRKVYSNRVQSLADAMKQTSERSAVEKWLRENGHIKKENEQ